MQLTPNNTSNNTPNPNNTSNNILSNNSIPSHKSVFKYMPVSDDYYNKNLQFTKLDTINETKKINLPQPIKRTLSQDEFIVPNVWIVSSNEQYVLDKLNDCVPVGKKRTYLEMELNL